MVLIHNEVTTKAAPQSASPRAAHLWGAALLFVALAAAAVILPMLFLGNASGHDFQFHLASWLDVAGQWHEGIIYPRWAEWANWGSGEPRFVFYPPASWMLGAALGSLLPWIMVPGTYIWLVLVLAGMSMWRFVREWLPGPEACAAAVFFAVNPYHLVIVYYRSDFAELLAGALFPFLLLGLLRVMREGWRGIPLLAAVFAAIWLSNAPAAVIATYSLALLLVVGCILEHSFRPLATGGGAMAAGFSLAAFYILPAAWEQRWVQIGQALTRNLRPLQNFLFMQANDPEFVFFNWKVSGVALSVMLIAGIATIFSARQRQGFREIWWMLVALGGTSALMMFPPSKMLWRYLPKLQFVQFPWRWLEPLGVVFAFFIAAMTGRPRRNWGRQWAIWVVVLLVAGASATAMVRDAWWDSDDISSLSDGIDAGHGYEGTDEYAPIGCDRYELPGAVAEPSDTPAPPVPLITKLDPETDTVVPAEGVRLSVERWTAEEKAFSAESVSNVTLALRLLNYPAWNIRVDGATVQFDSRQDTAQILVPLTQGTHRVEVRFCRTRDRTLGAAVSSFSAIGLIALAWVARRKTLGAFDAKRMC
jgi:hypothetical protein